MTTKDQTYMLAALTQAKLGNTMFGSVLVYQDEVVAKAHNTVAQTNDPSAHAELNLIRDFCKEQNTTKLAGFTVYTTAEPCPMCAALCAFTGVSEIVFGVSTADLLNLGAPQIELSCEAVVSRSPTTISVQGGVLRGECLAHCQALGERAG